MKIAALTGLVVFLAACDGTAAKNDKKKMGGLAEASFVLIGDSTTNNHTTTPNCKSLGVWILAGLPVSSNAFPQLEDGAMASALLCNPVSDAVRTNTLCTLPLHKLKRCGTCSQLWVEWCHHWNHRRPGIVWSSNRYRQSRGC